MCAYAYVCVIACVLQRLGNPVTVNAMRTAAILLSVTQVDPGFTHGQPMGDPWVNQETQLGLRRRLSTPLLHACVH